MRFIVLDTETTGLAKGDDVTKGHRIIEVAAVEVVDGKITGNEFHSLVNPGIRITPGATKIHGIKNISLVRSPTFRQIARDLLNFIGDSTLVIHNAPFDIAFLNKEFSLLDTEQQPKRTFKYIDTLSLARNMFPGENNKLDALVSRFSLGEEKRVHGALVDSKLLAKLFIILF